MDDRTELDDVRDAVGNLIDIMAWMLPIFADYESYEDGLALQELLAEAQDKLLTFRGR